MEEETCRGWGGGGVQFSYAIILFGGEGKVLIHHTFLTFPPSAPAGPYKVASI